MSLSKSSITDKYKEAFLLNIFSLCIFLSSKDRVKQKGTKPRWPLSNLIGQFNFLLENGCADFCVNFSEFSAQYEANSLKFSKISAQTFSRKEEIAQFLTIADVAWFLSANRGPFFPFRRAVFALLLFKLYGLT